jgi:hypothetical protein
MANRRGIFYKRNYGGDTMEGLFHAGSYAIRVFDTRAASSPAKIEVKFQSNSQ